MGNIDIFENVLLVDIGNSTINWAINGVYERVGVEDFTLSVIPPHQSALVSCVAHDDLISNFNNVTLVQPQAYKDLKFSYDFAQLGVDRFLAIIAGFRLFPQQDVMIVDVGTFVTIDVIQNNQHLSVGIAPGLEQLNNIRQFKGKDSQNAWKAGTQDMLTSYIEKHCTGFKGKILITGGGQGLVKIKAAHYHQNLVIQGLKVFHEQ